MSKEENATLKALRSEIERELLELSDDELLSIKATEEAPPQKASIHSSIKCDLCGEWAMETRIRLLLGKRLCMPCFMEMEKEAR